MSNLPCSSDCSRVDGGMNCVQYRAQMGPWSWGHERRGSRIVVEQ